MTISEKDLLREGTSLLGLSLTNHQLDLLISYCNEVESTNRFLNLTRIPRDQFVMLHVLDSLTLVPFLLQDSSRPLLIDIGTGAGFPAVPLAIVFPESKVVALDSIRKKILFVERTCKALMLSNIECIATRAEAFAQESSRLGPCIVVSRAVTTTSKLAALYAPFMKYQGSRGFMYKSVNAQQEVEESRETFRILRLRARTHSITLPLSSVTRVLVEVERIRP
jgi:16S rRNA (guanine527-N7)-methyltransferase